MYSTKLFCNNFINFRIFLIELNKNIFKNLKKEDSEKIDTDIVVENNYKDVVILKKFDKIFQYIPNELFNQEEKEEKKENFYIDRVEFLKFTNQNIKILNEKLEE